MTIAELRPHAAPRRAPNPSRRHARRPPSRALTLRLESLESLCLMTGGVLSQSVTAAAVSSVSLSATTPTFPSSPAQVSGLTNLNASVTLPGFNPALGTLTSVSIAATGSINGQITTTNTSVIDATITGSFSGGSVLLATAGNSNLLTVNLAPTQGTQVVHPNDTVTFNVTPSNTGSVVLTDTASLAAFTGANVSIPIQLTSQGNVVATSSVGLVNPVLTNTAMSSVTVTYTYNLAPASVSGFVYVDSNKDGLRTPGEIGLGGVTVVLTGANDLGTIAPITTTTDSAGAYDFEGLRPGDYTVTEPPPEPAGFTRGQNTRGNVTPLPFDPTVDAVPGIIVSAGGNAVENNFGKLVILPPPGAGGAALSGFVFNDTNNPNGIKEPGEPGLGSVVVTLTGTDEFGRSVSSTLTTAGDGSYLFGGLFGGTYTITEGASPLNFHHGLTSSNSIVIPNSFGTGLIPNVALTDGVTLTNNNFAELLTTVPQVPLNVVSVQRYGIHGQPTEVVISFNQALDPATAQNPANYQLIRVRANGTTIGAPVAIRGVIYNGTDDTVTLVTGLDYHFLYRLTIRNVTTAAGAPLVGSNGVPGAPYVTQISSATLAGFLNNQGKLVIVPNGVLTPAIRAQIPAPGRGSLASLVGYPVQVTASKAAAAARLAAAKAAAAARLAVAKAHALQVAASRVALRRHV